MVVATGGGGAAVVVVIGAAGVAVVPVLRDVVGVTVATGAALLEDCDDVDEFEPTVVVALACRAAAAALLIAASVDAATEAAVALVLRAVLVSDETMRRSLARVALRFARVWALRAAWRDT